MFLRTRSLVNGDSFTDMSVYECDNCSDEINDSDRHFIGGEDIHYCITCAFKKSLVNSEQFLEYIGYNVKGFHAAITPTGEITIWNGKDIPPWEREGDLIRRSAEYRRWRKEVLKRDNKQCKECCSKHDLHAHHIIPISVDVTKALDLSNGVTLCAVCHRYEHRKKE